MAAEATLVLVLNVGSSSLKAALIGPDRPWQGQHNREGAPIEAALAARDLGPFCQRRELPAWGSIVSPHVLFVRPADAAEERSFIDQVAGFLAVLGEAVAQEVPQAPDDQATVARWEGQLRYCKQQKQNDKTRRVLEKAFNPAWADQYIENLLFDDPPAPSSPS
jgi:phycocyanobilin:ferredoxin oxidoreductase